MEKKGSMKIFQYLAVLFILAIFVIPNIARAEEVLPQDPTQSSEPATTQADPAQTGTTSDTPNVPEESAPSDIPMETQSAMSSFSEGSESSAFSASNFQASVDPNTGAAVMDLKIAVPPGRGVQPELALKYNSNHKNGWLGVGWDIPIGYIQRNTKFGVNYGANDFVFNGSLELVQRGDWGANYYGAKVESAFSKYYYNSSTGGWEVTTKDGIKYFYGTSSQSRQENASGVFKWYLYKVEDTNDNHMYYYYIKDQGEVYLDTIYYSYGANGAPAKHYVKFNLESRSDAPNMYTSNYAVKTAKRLRSVETYTDYQLVRKYELLYENGTSTSKSRLTTLKTFGTDGISELPAINFTWQENGNSFASYPDSGQWQPGCGYEKIDGDFNGDGKKDFAIHYTGCGYQFDVWFSTDNGFVYQGTWGSWQPTGTYERIDGDFNGDGKTDFAIHYTNGIYQFQVWLSTGSSFSSQGQWGSWQPNTTAYERINGDFNADGKTDFAIHYTDGGYQFQIWSSTGSSFSTSGPSGSWQPNGYNYERINGDFNADGKTDFAIHYTGGTYEFKVWFSNGNTFVAQGTNWGTWQPGCTYERIDGDFNGDGKTDFGYHYTGCGYEFQVWLSSGRSFVSQPNWGSWQPGGTYERINGDFNGDGKIDFGIHYTGAGYQFEVLVSTGSSFVHKGTWGSWQPGCAYERIDGDFNGDGQTDFGYHYTGCGYQFERWLVGQSFPDLISTASNGIGSTTTISYKPSSQYVNTLLPYIVQTVSSMTVNDGLGNLSTMNYTYSGGFFSYPNREFWGFQYIKSTDPAGTTSETWFYQDAVLKGRPYEQIVKDSGGNIFTRNYYTYNSTSPYTGVTFPYIAQGDTYIYDGTDTNKRSTSSFTYDSYGNITRKYLYGYIGVSNDERDEYAEYAYDTTKWILNRPSHTYVYDSGGVKKAEAWFTYDTKGNLLTETRWLNGGTNPVVSYAYDMYGNRASVTDPRNYTTTTAYDGTYHVYPVQKVNHLGHTVSATYDPKFGRTLSETDPNGNTTTYEYDVFGRAVKATNPNDTSSIYGTVSSYYLNFGTPGSQKAVKYATEQSGTGNYLWVETYFDGLGRTIKTRREGPDSKIIVQEVTYNQRGLKATESLPYFEGLETPRWAIFAYDAVGRVTQVTKPDATVSTVSYDKGRTTFIDENGHKKVEEKDVYGRLIKVEEYTGTTGSYTLYATTNYQYDALGNLLSTTDALNNQTTISYDTLGRKTSMTDLDMGVWSYAYDANGNLTSQTDAKGQTITFTYDAINRVTLKDYPTGTDAAYTYDETWSTNKIGRLTTLSDASGTFKYYYDKLGQVTKSTQTVDGTPYTIETAYDALGRTTSVKYPDNEVVNYTYNSGGSLYEVAGFATYTDYNALGQPGSTSYGNGTSTAYQYLSTNNRLYSITTNGPSGGLLNISYSYDNAGNVAGITDLIDNNRSQSFSYDAINRIMQAQSTSYGTLAYSYNQIGNILSKEGISYTYGGSRPHAVTATSDGKSYAYDGNGNMTSDGTRTIAYDYDNMPSSMTLGGSTTNFVYSAAGGRVKKINGSVTTVYIGKIYECVNGACAKYIFAGDTRVALRSGAVDTYYYHQDHLNSSSIITNQTGAKVEEIYYYPFGGTRSDTGSTSVNHKYTSQELDTETGLYYYGARYYNPQLGRFISPDSIIPDPADPQAFNRYSYVLNNPLLYIDPTGNSSEDWWLEFSCCDGSGSGGGSSSWDFDWGGSGGSGWDPEWEEYSPPPPSPNAPPAPAPPSGMPVPSSPGEYDAFSNPAGNSNSINMQVIGDYTLIFKGRDPLGAFRKYLEEAIVDQLSKGNTVTGFAGTVLLTVMPSSYYEIPLMFMGGIGKAGINIVKIGSRELVLSQHALERMTQRSISVQQIEKALQVNPFEYYHKGVWKAGYYDPVSKIFVGEFDNEITTVINNVKPKYIQNIMKAKP